MARKITPIWFDADNDVTWTGAYAGGAYLNTATVTWSLKAQDSGETELGTGTCTYVAASNGNYLGTIDEDTTDGLTENTKYWLDVTLVQGGYEDRRRDQVVCMYRPLDGG